MWLTPDSTTRRRMATAVARSLGGPNTPGPGSCIAPKPIWRTGRPARWKVVSGMPTACRALAGFSAGSAKRSGGFRLAQREQRGKADHERLYAPSARGQAPLASDPTGRQGFDQVDHRRPDQHADQRLARRQSVLYPFLGPLVGLVVEDEQRHHDDPAVEEEEPEQRGSHAARP